MRDSLAPNTRRAYLGALACLNVWLDARAFDDHTLAVCLGHLDAVGRAPVSDALWWSRPSRRSRGPVPSLAPSSSSCSRRACGGPKPRRWCGPIHGVLLDRPGANAKARRLWAAPPPRVRSGAGRRRLHIRAPPGPVPPIVAESPGPPQWTRSLARFDSVDAVSSFRDSNAMALKHVPDYAQSSALVADTTSGRLRMPAGEHEATVQPAGKAAMP